MICRITVACLRTRRIENITSLCKPEETTIIQWKVRLGEEQSTDMDRRMFYFDKTRSEQKEQITECMPDEIPLQVFQ